MAAVELARVASGYGGPLVPSNSAALTLNGSGIGVAWIVQAQTVSAITSVKFRTAVRTGTPPTYVVTIETVGADGRPSGTDAGGGSPTATTFTPPADTSWNGTVRTIALTNSYTPASKSEWIAITIRHSSGTVDASNCMSFTYRWAGLRDTPHLNLPYMLSGGAWTAVAAPGSVGWITASENLGCVIKNNTINSTTAATNGHRAGAYFTLPAGLGTSVVVRGVQMAGIIGAAGTSFKIVLLATDNTVMASETIDADLSQGPSAERQILCYFGTPPTLQCGTKYRLALEVAGSAAVTISGWDFDSSADQSVMPLGGSIGLAMWNNVSWTETATEYPVFELILDDLTAAGGGAGAIVIGNSGSVIRGVM